MKLDDPEWAEEAVEWFARLEAAELVVLQLFDEVEFVVLELLFDLSLVHMGEPPKRQAVA